MHDAQLRMLIEHRAALAPALARNSRVHAGRKGGVPVDEPDAIRALERAWNRALKCEGVAAQVRISREEYEAFPNRKAHGGPVPASFWIWAGVAGSGGHSFLSFSVAELWPTPTNPILEETLAREALRDPHGSALRGVADL